MPGSIPFTKKCDAYQRMVELLEDGTIGPDMAPRDAYRTDPVFLQYSEVAFKSQLKKWKDANGMAGRPPKRVKEPSYCHQLAFGIPGESTQENAMIDRGLQKLTNSTPQWNSLSSRISGVQSTSSRVKQEPNDFLFGLSSSDPKKPPTTAGSGSQDEWHPVHFTTTFKDDDLRHRQAVVILLPSGVTHSEDINVAVESEGMILKVSVAIPHHITDPAEFLHFQNQQSYKRLMSNGEGTRKYAFYEMLSKIHNTRGETMWRHFNLNLDIACIEDIPIISIMKLQASYSIYIELMAREKQTYMHAYGRVTCDVIDVDAGND